MCIALCITLRHHVTKLTLFGHPSGTDQEAQLPLCTCQVGLQWCTHARTRSFGIQADLAHEGKLIPVLANSFWHTQSSQTLNASKAVKPTIFHSPKWQRLAHVGAAKIIDTGHASLHNSHKLTYVVKMVL